MKKWYTKKEMIEMLEISVPTMQRLMRAGMPFQMYKTKFGSKAVFNIEEVLPWYDKHKEIVQDMDADMAEEIRRDIGE